MIKHVTSPEVFRLEQSPDSVGPLLSQVFECVPGLRDLNGLTLCCWCLSLSNKGTAWNWVHLLGVRPNVFLEISWFRLPALSVPLRRLAVGVAWLFLNLLASVLTWIVYIQYKGNYNYRRGGAVFKRIVMLSSYLKVLKKAHLKVRLSVCNEGSVCFSKEYLLFKFQ